MVAFSFGKQQKFDLNVTSFHPPNLFHVRYIVMITVTHELRAAVFQIQDIACLA